MRLELLRLRFPIMSTHLVLALLCCFFAFSYGIPTSSCAILQQATHHIGLSENVHFNSSSIAVGALEFQDVNSTNEFPLCRVIGTITYGAKNNNTLNFELWLPDTWQYNGRYLSVGMVEAWIAIASAVNG